ncbi:MAG: hypothetical protein ACYTF1_22300 [Planctomycetota bacterium]
MNKQEIIDRIRNLNNTANDIFLASFDEDQLLAYLHQLKEVERERQQIEETELVYGNS